MPSSSSTLTADEIASVAAKAGFGKDQDTLAKAVAIAIAESSGRTGVSSVTGCCIGLWQINTEVHPYTKAQMRDPEQNAAAAWIISKQGTYWNPWDVYTNGKYLLYMPTAKAAAKKITANDIGSGFLPGSTADDFMNAGDTISDIAHFPELVREWISDRNNIMRIAKVAIGIALLVGGAVLVIKPAVESVAGSAVGVVAKGLKK